MLYIYLHFVSSPFRDHLTLYHSANGICQQTHSSFHSSLRISFNPLLVVLTKCTLANSSTPLNELIIIRKPNSESFVFISGGAGGNGEFVALFFGCWRAHVSRINQRSILLNANKKIIYKYTVNRVETQSVIWNKRANFFHSCSLSILAVPYSFAGNYIQRKCFRYYFQHFVKCVRRHRRASQAI